jgi:hypothetical protein
MVAMRTLVSDHKYVAAIETKENFLVKEDRMLLNAFTVYAGNQDQPNCGRLVQFINTMGKSDSGEGVLYRISDDNGDSWTEAGVFDKAYRADHTGGMVRRLSGACFYDDEAGVLIQIINEMLWEHDQLPSIFKKRRLRYRLSFDNGSTWTDAMDMIQNADGYDRTSMFPGITYGCNMIASVICVRKLRGAGPRQGQLVVGVQVQKMGDNGDIFNPTGMGFFQAGCLLGKWNPDKLQYEWTACETYAEVSIEDSTRGVYEPAIEELPDRRLIMILRGSNMRNRLIPGTKFISISEDQGVTWSRPQRWNYSDGGMMFASSCSPELVKDRKGNLFFIGVINTENPDGNLPRYPLCIAAVDPATLGVERSSVVVLDTIRASHTAQLQDNPRYPVDYSNQYAYLDAFDNKIIVYSPYRADLHKFEAAINRYDVYLQS